MSVALGYSPAKSGATTAKAPLPYYVTAYGAKGDGVTDDTQAIIDCATAAGTGGHVYFPPGRYVITGNAITGLPDQQTWEGSGYQLGVGGITSVAEIRMVGLTGAEVGIVAGTNHVFKNLLFRGSGKTGNTVVGISTANHVQFDWCQFYGFFRAVSMTGAFYPRFLNCEWRAVGVGVYFADACYNVHFVNPIFRLWDDTTSTGGIAIATASSARNISIHGGSIEDFNASGGLDLSAGSHVVIVGTYWESSKTGSLAVGIVCGGDTCVVSLYGNEVYLTELDRWVSMSGKDKCVLDAHGNHFVCSAGSTSSPRAYYLPSNGTGGYVHLSADSWSDVALAGATYVGASLNAGPIAHATIIAPTDYSNFANAYEFKGRPLALVKSAAAPATPLAGAIAVADKTNWNPLGRTSANAYPVFYDGSRWCAMGQPAFVGSAVYDPPSLADGAGVTTTVVVAGAVLGDRAAATFSLDTQGITITAWVSATNTVSVRLHNTTGATVDLASGTLRAIVERL